VKRRSDTICLKGLGLTSGITIKDPHLFNRSDPVPGKSYHFAIDFPNDPYYGGIIDVNKDYVIKSKMKDSTTTFYSDVSLYITIKGQWLILAVLPVKKGVSTVEYIRKFPDFDDVNVND